MIGKEISDRATGFLLLLLIPLMFYALKPLFSVSRSHSFPCEKPLFVQIEGEIGFPGIYPFCDRGKLKELIEKAGGVSAGSYPSGLFKDVALHSGARVLVRSDEGRYRFLQKEMSAFHKITLGIPVSLNSESEEGLTAVPGIGPGLARAIAEERSKRGAFNSVDEIMVITGIGDRLFRRMRPHLKL
jgi:competence protein ComEA